MDNNDIHDALHYVDFCNDVDGSNLMNKPSNYNLIQSNIDKFITQQEVADKIRNQYIDFNNLGVDIISDYGDIYLTDDLLYELLQFINDNIFPITYIDIIYDDEIRLRELGKIIYRILYVDFVKETCKFLCKNLQLKYCEDLLSLKDEDIKKNLILIYSDLLKQASTLSKINPNIINTTLKYSQAIDLFDNDISLFKENFLIPAINKNSTIINAGLV